MQQKLDIELPEGTAIMEARETEEKATPVNAA